MFQKKSNLPARPAIPIKEEIQEDLFSAKPDDIVFRGEAENKVSLEDESSVDIKDVDQNKEFLANEPSQAYAKISSFVDKMNHLEEKLAALSNKKSNLLKLEESLLKDIAQIKDELSRQS